MGRCDNLRRKLYQPDQWDNDRVFLKRIEACIRPGSVVLDLGAGAGLKFKYDLKSKVEPPGGRSWVPTSILVCARTRCSIGVL
jgi:hypothetical protein